MTDKLGRLMDAAVRSVTASPDAFEKTLSRADHLRRGRRVSTILVTFGILAAAGIFVWVGFQPAEVDRRASPGEGVGPAGTASVPPDSSGPDATVMSLTFPDGTGVDLMFPAEIGLEDLSVRASITGGIRDVDGTERTLQAYLRPPESIPVLGDRVVKTFEGFGGEEVALVEGDPEAGADLYLVFRFDTWTVLAYDTIDNGMSDEQRGVWARSLQGRTDESGFLLLEAAEPLVLEGPGFPSGPQLLLVGPNHIPEVVVYPATCAPDPITEVEVSPLGESGWHASWCPPDGVAMIQATGDRDFVLKLVEGLTVKQG